MKSVVKSAATHKEVSLSKVREIKKLYSEMQSLFLAALEKAIRMGDILSGIKEELPHGQFGIWIDNSGLPFKARTAQLYMRLYERREELQQAGIGTVGEAQKFLSSGGNVDHPNTQSFAYLGTEESSNEAAFEQLELKKGDAHPTIKLTVREQQLVTEIIAAGGDKKSAEEGIRIQKWKAKQERERKQKEKQQAQELAKEKVHFKHLEVPPNVYRRFSRLSKKTGRPIADLLVEAADTMAKGQKR